MQAANVIKSDRYYLNTRYVVTSHNLMNVTSANVFYDVNLFTTLERQVQYSLLSVFL